ncbi:hypothetical protein BKA66DRAFT_431791 [Pyrenochaeta sp. MPI-SDFR-AT-0127]|nr:hypothetical protein BKA66DRAFT_431791 [Pyrenochaeta sp. MPI-SDFR-AT-0127]
MECPIESEPTEKQGWYSAPNYRSTIEVLWSCLITIFLCCWAAVHPDIPAPNSTLLQQYLDRTLCLLIGAVAPEIFIYLALAQRSEAREKLQSIKVSKAKERWTITHCFYETMGGFGVRWNSHGNIDPNGRNISYLGAETICGYFRDGRIDPKLWITEKDIRDKGKADGLIKIVTLSQIIWLLLQSIARLIQGLPLTTLEVSTLAYIPCAISIYGLWWDKPYEVSVPTILIIERPGNFFPRIQPWRPETVGRVNRNYPLVVRDYQIYGLTRECLDAVRSSFRPMSQSGLTASVFLLVGAIHIAAWNFEFPTLTEQRGWRICSLLITASIPFSWWCSGILQWVATGKWWEDAWYDLEHPSRRVRWLRQLCFAIHGTCIVLYAAARSFLLVEAFMGLRAAPGAVYKTPEWTSLLPHFG